jgi:YVTN family beta-propeller protein
VTQFDTRNFSQPVVWPATISGGRVPANWNGTVNPQGGCGSFSTLTQGWGPQTVSQNQLVGTLGCNPASVAASFFLTNAIPSTFTVQASGFTSNNGTPRLNVYSHSAALVSQSLATSVSADGSTVTFNFPKNSDGTALAAEHYGFNVDNQTSPGTFSEVAGNFFSLGTNDSSHTTPFGVDAVDVTVSGYFCFYPPGKPGSCSNFNSTSPYPLLTLSSAGQVYFKGATIAVGSQPTAIKGYAVASQTQYFNSTYERDRTTTTQPSRAIVTNFGSNTVSIVDLFNYVVVQTIPVGTEPTAVLIGSGTSTAYAAAYVANFGSSAISEINLSTNSQSRVAAVGPQPDALAMDPSGTAIWVGGLNYISKVDLTSFSVV